MKDLMLKSIRDNLTYKHLWCYLSIGVAMIFIGFLCLMISNSKFRDISYFCIGGFIMQGICDIFFSVSNKVIMEGWWWQVIKGEIGILLGLFIVFLAANNLSLEVTYFIGFWFLTNSVCFIGELFELKHKIPNGWALILALSAIEIILSILYLIFAICYNNTLGYFILFLMYGTVKLMMWLKYYSWNKEVVKVIV